MGFARNEGYEFCRFLETISHFLSSNTMASVNYPSSFDKKDEFEDMSILDKIWFRCKQQPLVPIGCLATCVAVALAAKGVRTGDRVNAQKWFRWRVGLQGLTLVALVGGSYIYDRQQVTQRKTDEDLAREKAQHRQDLWIQELERRDQETKRNKERARLARARLEAERSTGILDDEPPK